MIIAWDFDGVLNRNHDGRRYVWEDEFEQTFGRPAAEFGSFVFADRAPHLIAGEIDILDRLDEWVTATGMAHRPDDILATWLEMDAKPDAEMMALVEALGRAGTRQVVATNNEARRAAYIADQMGMAARVERVFASGPMGVAKPHPRYYSCVTAALDADPGDILFVDDKLENVTAAMDAGWQGFHFTDQSRNDLIERLRP